MKLMTTIDVTLGRGQNMREHYRVRADRVKEEREATAKALKAQPLAGEVRWEFMAERTAFDGARVTLMRPIARIPLDTDNLSGAFKGVRDEVAAFLGVDDRSDRIHWIYTQEKGKNLKPTVTIEVMPVADIDPQAKRVRELEECLRESMEALVEVAQRDDDGPCYCAEWHDKHKPWCLDARKSLEHTRRLLGMVTT
jgi:hypothetical protein